MFALNVFVRIVLSTAFDQQWQHFAFSFQAIRLCNEYSRIPRMIG